MAGGGGGPAKVEIGAGRGGEAATVAPLAAGGGGRRFGRRRRWGRTVPLLPRFFVVLLSETARQESTLRAQASLARLFF